MRNMFAKTLKDFISADESIMLFYADIGNRLFNPIKDLAPERVVNAGIAEANMASMAAGAAKLGLRPFIFTITPFTTARNFEQIKIDIAYQNLSVVIVGTGSGLSYANLGPTHHSFEDIALMRVLPNMQVVCPCDSFELKALMKSAVKSSSPTYLRIGKKNEPLIHQQDTDTEIGKVNIINEGNQVVILAVGTIMDVAFELFEELTSKSISVELVSFHTVKPLDTDYLRKMLSKFEKIILLEEHSYIGGLGSAIFEWMNSQGLSGKIEHFAIPDTFIDSVGSVNSAREKVGLTKKAILDKLSFT